MEFIFTFLEGFASFISPCLLPMLPIYISYFAGNDDKKIGKTLINACGFVLGFTIIFILLSIFTSKLGIILNENIKYIKIIFGIIIIILGLNYMDIVKINFLNKTANNNFNSQNFNFLKSFLFGVFFSVSWTPCIGTFLASALLMVANEQETIKGVLLMLMYSIGLGLPFLLSAILIEKLKEVFEFIKNNYIIVKKISGMILIFMGIYMFIG